MFTPSEQTDKINDVIQLQYKDIASCGDDRMVLNWDWNTTN